MNEERETDRQKERKRQRGTLGTEGEVVQGVGGDDEASGGCADVGEAVLEDVDFQIGLLFH